MCIEKFDFPICNASHSHLPLQSSSPFTSPQPHRQSASGHLEYVSHPNAFARYASRSRSYGKISSPVSVLQGVPYCTLPLACRQSGRPLFPFLDAGLKDLLRTCLGATVRGNPQGYWCFKLCTRKPELNFFRTSLRHSKSIRIISMREIIFPRYA